MSSSPTSPILGITPRWLLQSSKGVSSARYALKILALGFVCIFLGVSVSSLYRVEGSIENESSYDTYQHETLSLSHGIYREGPNDQPSYLYGLSRAKSLHHDAKHPASPTSHASPLRKLAGKISWWGPWRSQSSKAETSANSLDPLGELYAHDASQQTREVILDPVNATAAAPPVIAKVTIVTGGPSTIYERALRTHAAHNRIHGYPMHTLRQSILSDVWSKPAYILSVLLRELAKPAHARLQWLFWVDADTVIINPHVAVEAFLPPAGWADDVHLLVAHDFNGLNNGVFPLRVHPWSVELLAAVLSYPVYAPGDFLLFRDQSAMARLLERPRFARHTVRAPQRWFNAYQGEINETIAPFQTRPGDLLVHFAGVPNRDERMLWWLERAEEHLPEWEVEYRYTSYKTETREFWEGEKSRREAARKAVRKMREEMDQLKEVLKHGLERWGDALSNGERRRIDDALVATYRTFEDDNTALNIDAVRKAMSRFREAFKPLQVHLDKQNKLLLKEAHAVLFKAENMTVSLAPKPATKDDLRNLEHAITRFKEVLLAPVFQAERIEEEMGKVQQRQKDVEKKLEDLEREREEAEARRLRETQETDELLKKKMMEKAERKRLKEVASGDETSKSGHAEIMDLKQADRGETDSNGDGPGPSDSGAREDGDEKGVDGTSKEVQGAQ